MKRSYVVGLLMVGALLGLSNVAKAAAFDPINKDDIVHIEELSSPKAYRVTELSISGSGDLKADFITYCVNVAGPIQTGDFKVTGFGFLTGAGLVRAAEVAYLYYQYRNGLIPPGYDDPLPASGVIPGPKRPDGLQEAIWFLLGQPGIGATENALAKQAECAVEGVGVGCPGKSWPFITDDVFVMHLAFINDPFFGNSPAQDMLVRLERTNIDNQCVQVPGAPECGGIPVPEPGSMFLLGSGLVGLATTIRRRLGRRN